MEDVWLTAQMVLAGDSYRKQISVTAYGGAKVTIRPLTDIEMGIALGVAGYDMTMLAALEQANDAIGDDQERAKSILGKLPLDDRLFRLMVEVCRMGIVDPALASAADKLRGNASVEIGNEIMSITALPPEVLDDFFGAREGDLSRPSTERGTPSETSAN